MRPDDDNFTARRPGRSGITPFRILVVLTGLAFFSLLGSYYFHQFSGCRRLNDPLADLMIVKTTDPTVIADFRARTLERYIGPTQEISRLLIALRQESKVGAVVPENFEQRREHLANGLQGLMEQAKRVTIPKSESKKYVQVLLAIAENYRSLRAFEEAMAATIPADRERAIATSIMSSKSSRTRLRQVEAHFRRPLEVTPAKPQTLAESAPPPLSHRQ